ncbi:glycerol-3-phosphate dehydrogenase/oxidase [Kurthia sibirica]|uniref:Glycerol-3-phosphate dehydrogenase n=1 Tax=Kurthia sibirica TaxID=202750 RepID=A0A2U3AR09_9BACL|nr:glycerol-3-phosphate dehydrogenase/oxidase [Kurthia sibirica]PWI26973.1 glycerol-3-phosphate dehydrogenase [Kurthia sibirica]GEK32478.1 aerobic glycerol-3-phosphate dehydrogenase [Kurthia sibirica]
MFSAAQRNDKIDLLDRYSYDVLVIGGGITGAGIALDAVSRGMSVALVDMQDFSAGTSSRSTKLIHGGLRYLKQLQVGIVAEVGRERAIVYENGVHITTPLGMLLPFYAGGQFGPASTSLGLMLYDRLAGVKKKERRKMLSVKETLQKEPLLKSDGLKGGGHYIEYRTDDARLTIEVLKKAVELGAVALNYMKVTELIYNDKKQVCGAKATDQIKNKQITIAATSVVNATGPWVDAMRQLDVVSNNKKLTMTKGVHIVIDQSVFPLQQAVYFDTPDKRMVFAIPREGKAYIGTTDTFYDNNPIHPVATNEDIAYLLQAVHYIFPKLQITQKDVESSWAGVRPLIYEEGKDPSEISRHDEIWEAPTGLLTIAGGKLTGYRKMAADIVDKIAKRPGYKLFKECSTKNLSLSGADMINSSNFEAYIAFKASEGVENGLTKQIAENLTRKYGTNIDQIFKILRVTKSDYTNRGLPVELYLQIMYAMQFEMAYTPADVLVRRTGKMYFDIEAIHQYKDEIIELMSDFLQYTEAEESVKRVELDQLLFDASHFAKEGIYE